MELQSRNTHVGHDDTRSPAVQKMRYVHICTVSASRTAASTPVPDSESPSNSKKQLPGQGGLLSYLFGKQTVAEKSAESAAFRRSSLLPPPPKPNAPTSRGGNNVFGIQERRSVRTDDDDDDVL